MPSKAKSVSLSKNFSPYIGLTGRPAAAAALQEIQGFRQQLSFELVVHIEHIANAYDVALADFNRRRMHHRPGRFGGGTRQHPLATEQGGFVAGGAVGFTGFENEGGFAVEADVFGDGLGAA